MNIEIKDSIRYSETNDGIPTKTIYYPSKQKDSFKLRSYFIDDKLVDSMYITDNGFILGNTITFDVDEIKKIHEYLNIYGENFLNQFWCIKGKDTLDTYGNYFNINLDGSIEKNKYFQVEILLRKSYRENFSKIFFLTPKEHYSVLNSDFSNHKEIVFDTIRSVVNDGIIDNETYKENYWSKRSIVYKTGFAKGGKNYIRGILVERKDTIWGDNNEFKFIDRYLFVNEEINVLDNGLK
ncbi:hypothetical protein A9Q86_01505 [Flavobacteriales bacterium 33_180_T64]|nr:hypothetical protein A9Q86_01505 [Flavobacteriales bacterium 33_180_T64]